MKQDKAVNTISLPPQADVGQAIANLQNLLAKPQLAAINLDYKKLRGTTKHWHRLNGGPVNIRDLAYHVGKAAQYEILYRSWSRVSHAHDLAAFVAWTPVGQSAIKRIRDPSDLNEMANFAASFMLAATRTLIKKFRPDEDITTWYKRDIRPVYSQLRGSPE